MIGDLDAARESVAMLVDLAARRGLPFWQTVGRALEGTLAVRRGEFALGSSLLRSALDDHVRPGWIMRFPEFIGALAEGLAGQEQFPDALSTLEPALASAERGETRWYVAELLRIKGELLLQGDGNLVQAETSFREALDVARRQGALLWELRSAMSLTRLLRRQGRPEDARQILSPVYSRFSEGFDAADLRTAQATLESLSDQPGAG
jgi:predicted ATPase